MEELEEERRILYVAITRAKINCYLSYAKERLFGNDIMKRNESPFLSEINDSKYIQIYDLDQNENYINNEIKYRNNNNYTNFKEKKDIRIIMNNNNNEQKNNDNQKNNLGSKINIKQETHDNNFIN